MLEALLIIIADMNVCTLQTSHRMRDLELSGSKIPRTARYQPFMLEALLIIIADMNVCALQTSHTMRDLELSASPRSHALHDLSPLCLKLSCSLHL
jgi:hypothetical protein